VGVGASYDNPAEATIVFFVTRGQPHSDLPQQVDGVRTRIVENEVFGVHGLVSATESAALEQSAAEPLVTYPISQAEVARAKVVQAAHQAELLKQQGVQGGFWRCASETRVRRATCKNNSEERGIRFKAKTLMPLTGR
jgi:hypothetical protein